MAFKANYQIRIPHRELTTINQILKGIWQTQSYPGRHQHLSVVEMEPVRGAGCRAASELRSPASALLEKGWDAWEKTQASGSRADGSETEKAVWSSPR